jgi:hypothetical protein
MKAKLFLAMVSIILIHCSKPDRNLLLQGTWKTDSAYSFYNGFGQMKRDFEEEPLHHYLPDSRLKMTRENEFRFFLYAMPTSDSLVHLNSEKKAFEKFLILALDKHHLTLKKEMAPIFKGPNQERYEILFFSKVKE